MIDLTALSPYAHTPKLIDFGGFLTPDGGGPLLRVDRMGNRHAIDIVLPPMRMEPTGRIWIARLKRAKTEGATIRMPQVELTSRVYGAITVAAPAVGGRSLSLAGGAGVLREGQWLSILHGGRRYLHSIDGEALFAADGTATVSVTPMLRVALTVGDAVEVAQPRMDGVILDELSWPIASNRTVSLTFTLTEAA